MASNGHFTAKTVYPPSPPSNANTLATTCRKTNWNYKRDMIIDKPRKNMNKNYEYYLQLDRTVCQISLCIIMHSATHRGGDAPPPPPDQQTTATANVPSVLWYTSILFSYRCKKSTSTSAMLWMGLAIAVSSAGGGRGEGWGRGIVAPSCSNILPHVLRPRKGDAK